MKVFIIGINGRVAKRHIKAWKELGWDVYGCGSNIDYRELINDGYDIIDICTPIYLHADMIRYCHSKGHKVICEKPLSVNEDVKDILNFDKTCIIYQFRFNPKVLKLREELKEEKFGDIKMVTANYFRWRGQDYYKKWEWDKMKAGGGTLFNVCIHYVDLLQWLFGYPTEVKGMMTTSKQGLDVEDNVVASLRFPNGAIGSINLSTHVNPPKHFELSVYGTKEHKTIQLRQNEYHKENFKAFIKGENYVTPLEAFKSLRICHDIYRDANGEI